MPPFKKERAMAETTTAATKTPARKPAARAKPKAAATGPKRTAAAEARTVAKTTVEKVKESVGSVASEAVGAAKKAATEGKDRATEALTGVAKVVNDAAQVVEDKVGATYGDYARRAATGVSNVAESLQKKDVDDLIADARNFIRKNPAVAIGAAAAVGFALMRLIKVGSAADSDEA
jgi:ElaB/YqjD/DUF883 family membrane-anchored ribosome-binding protein